MQCAADTRESLLARYREFYSHYPSWNSILAKFQAAYWAAFVEGEDNYILKPCPTLAECMKLYGVSRTQVSALIGLQLSDLYKMAQTKSLLDASAFDVPAGLFFSRNGKSCNLYQLVIYFAKYLTDYKGSLQSFAIDDVLKQYSRFVSVWQSKIARKEDSKVRKLTGGVDGKAEMYAYLANAASRGLDLTEGAICKRGLISIDEARSIMLDNPCEGFAERYEDSDEVIPDEVQQIRDAIRVNVMSRIGFVKRRRKAI